MKLDELQHVLRASAAISKENSFVVVGSQAVLVSREIDLYPALHPERADLIDGAIGMHSSFRELLKHGLVSAATLTERIGMLDAAKYPLPKLTAWVVRRKLESEGTAP